MNGINLTVAGNLTRDPDYTTVGSGTSLTKFSIAVERRFRSGEEWDKSVSYIDIVCWKDMADQAAQLLTKGTRVIVSGRLDQQTWEDRDTGAKRSRFELTADELAISLRSVESFERKVYSDNGQQPAMAGARNGGGQRSNGGPRPQQAPRRPAPQASYDDDSVWDN